MGRSPSPPPNSLLHNPRSPISTPCFELSRYTQQSGGHAAERASGRPCQRDKSKETVGGVYQTPVEQAGRKPARPTAHSLSVLHMSN